MFNDINAINRALPDWVINYSTHFTGTFFRRLPISKPFCTKFGHQWTGHKTIIH